MSEFIVSKGLWRALWECGRVAHFHSAVPVIETRAKSLSRNATSYGRFRDFWERSTDFISHVAGGYVKKIRSALRRRFSEGVREKVMLQHLWGLFLGGTSDSPEPAIVSPEPEE